MNGSHAHYTCPSGRGGSWALRARLGHDVDEVVEELTCKGPHVAISALHRSPEESERTDCSRLEVPLELGIDEHSLAEVRLTEGDLDVLTSRLEHSAG